MKNTLLRLFTLIVCTVSAAVALYMWGVRFTLLQEAPIYDEVYSLITASPAFSLAVVWKEMLLQDVNLPLFNVLLHGWAQLVPFTVPWMRVLPWVFSILLLPAAWKFAPKTWSNSQKFTLCALLAGSFSLTSYSATLRAYAMGIFGTLLFTLFALQLAEKITQHAPVSRLEWSRFFITGFITAWLHYFGAALFFSTCLYLFLRALAAKKYRKRIFTCTALAFAGWIPWVIHIYYSLNHFQTDWWFQKPLLLSSWGVWSSLLGSPAVGIGLFCFVIVGLISTGFTQKKAGILQPVVSLPLFQVTVLIGVVWGVSHRYNLWLDRYFLMALPGLFILLSALLRGLCSRNRLFGALLPLLLINWMFCFWNKSLPETQDPSGLRDAFEWISTKDSAAYVVLDPISYPEITQLPFLTYYLQGTELEIRPLVPRANKGWLVLPLCSFVSLMQTTDKYQINVPDEAILFKQACVIAL